MKEGKKFDICLMNPPYGARKQGNANLHFEFVIKCNKICNTNVVVMPTRILLSTKQGYNDYKKIFDNTLLSISEYENPFNDTVQGSAGVYVFYSNKKESDTIKIYNINGDKTEVKSLLDIGNRFTKYEEDIIKYIDCNGKYNYIDFLFRPKDKTKDNLEKFFSKFNDNDWFLITNRANGSGRPATYYTNNTGEIFVTNNALNNTFIKNFTSCVLMKFNSKEEAENCKIALMNPLLRFALHKMKDDHNISKRVRQYIPNIDWSDDRVRTDEGLLEVCGCPKNKIKEYVNYTKEYIKKVDDEYDNRKRK